MFKQSSSLKLVKSRQLGLCLVCGDDAVGINFTVPTCAPCKAFFRRNAVKLGRIDFVCPLDGDCQVTHESRRTCNCCRLAKCFRVGMQKSLILSETEKASRNDLVHQNRKMRVYAQMNKQIQLIRSSNLSRSNYKCLSSSDQTLLTSIFSAYERTFIAARDSQHPHFPSQAYPSIHTLFNDYTSRYMALIDFIKLIPELNLISLDDRICLMRNHFGMMFLINEASSATEEDSTRAVLQNIYGIDLTLNLSRCNRLIQPYTHDPILLKLLLIVCSLSSTISRNFFYTHMDNVYHDTRTILAVQNVYVELLWRYIRSRSPSEEDAVKSLNKIILDLLVTVRVCYMFDVFIYNAPGEIEKMNSLMQCMWPRQIN